MTTNAPTENSIGRARNRGSATAAALLIAPVCAYGLTMIVSVLAQDMIHFGRLDLALLAAVLAYGVGVVFVLMKASRLAAAKVIMIVYCAIATLALAEVPLRLWYPPALPAMPWSPGRHVSTAGNAMPGITGTIEFTVNSLGLRGPDVDLEAVATRILAVGGSTTECLYITDKRSWPWALQDKLALSLRKSVFVGNAGKSGLLSIHHDYLLKNYPLVDRFEWVVVLVGINDMGTFLRRNYENRKLSVAEETLTPTYQNQAVYRRLTPFRVLQRLTVLGIAGETVVQDPQGDWYDRARRLRRERLRKRTIREKPSDFDRALSVYAANLRSIIETTRENGQRLVLVTQPTMYSKDLPESLQQLIHESVGDGAHTVEVLAEMMDDFNRTLIDVARQNGVDFVDLAAILPKDTSIFYDDAHFNDSGSERVATELAKFLGPRLDNPASAIGTE